jgi:hypothetical protein
VICQRVKIGGLPRSPLGVIAYASREVLDGMQLLVRLEQVSDKSLQVKPVIPSTVPLL